MTQGSSATLGWWTGTLSAFPEIRGERRDGILGAHTYERVDKPRGEFFHINWTGTGGRMASFTCTV